MLWRSLPANRRVAGLTVAVPRFSNVAIGAVLALIATGIGASILQLPTLASLWETGYGQALLVKIALLSVAVLLAAVNLLRTRPRLLAGRADAAGLLRRLVGAEAVVVAGAVFAAAVLTSLAPPAKAVADLGKPAARVGPGPVATTVEKAGYTVEVRVDAQPGRGAEPLPGAAEPGRQARDRRRRHRDLRHAGHGDGDAGLQAARDRIRASTSARHRRW